MYKLTVSAMTKFIKDSFNNGNRFTNIVLSICSALLMIIGWFLVQLYSDQKDINAMTRENNATLKEVRVDIKRLDDRGMENRQLIKELDNKIFNHLMGK